MDKIFYQTVCYKNIKVSYLPLLDKGGGRSFGQEYIRVIREKVGKVDHIFEYCAGPGFIGFSLLSQELCNRLTLADINPDAVKACQRTIEENHLEDRVSVYLSDCLDSIPLTEKWDLVVSNPPHFLTLLEEIHKRNIHSHDLDFRVHRKFYKNIKKFLKPDGSIIIQENSHSSKPQDFSVMISEGGLEVVDVFHANRQSKFYFIWSKMK